MKKPQHKFTGLRCAAIGRGPCELCADCGWVPIEEMDSPCIVGRDAFGRDVGHQSKKPKPMMSRGMYADMAAEMIVRSEELAAPATFKGLLYIVAAGLGIVTQVLLDIRDQVEDLRAASTAPPKDTW